MHEGVLKNLYPYQEESPKDILMFDHLARFLEVGQAENFSAPPHIIYSCFTHDGIFCQVQIFFSL